MRRLFIPASLMLLSLFTCISKDVDAQIIKLRPSGVVSGGSSGSKVYVSDKKYLSGENGISTLDLNKLKFHIYSETEIDLQLVKVVSECNSDKTDNCTLYKALDQNGLEWLITLNFNTDGYVYVGFLFDNQKWAVIRYQAEK